MAEQNGAVNHTIVRHKIGDGIQLRELWLAKEEAEARLTDFLEVQYKRLGIDVATDRVELNPWTGVVTIAKPVSQGGGA